MSGDTPAGVAEGAVDPRILVGTVFAVFAVSVSNTTSAAVAQPAIGQAFGAGPDEVGWVVFGYSAAFAIMTAVYGGLAARFGMAPCLAFGVTLVAGGAVLAMVAVDLTMLIAARVVQGVGAGAIPTLSMSLLARHLGGGRRAQAMGVAVAAVGIGTATGPLVGGLLLQAFGWPGAMALGVLVAPAAIVFLRLDRDRGSPTAPVDGPGILLIAVTVLALVFVLNRLPVTGLTLTLAVCVATVLLGGWQLARRARDRADAAIPGRIIGDRRLIRLMMLAFLGQTAFLGAIVVAPLALAMAHGLSGLGLGLALVPMAVTVALVSPQNGRVQAAIGRPATTALSLVLLSGGAFTLAVLGAGAPVAALTAALIVVGVGFSLLNAPLTNEVTRLYPGEDRSVALGIYNLCYFLGSATGGAVATAFVGAGIPAPLPNDSALPGFAAAMLVVGIGPAIGAAIIVGRRVLGRADDS